MSLSNFVISVRNVKKHKKGDLSFGNEPGPTRYLLVPDGEKPHPEKHKLPRVQWVKKLAKRAERGRHPVNPKSAVSGYAFGDILIFVHGFNNAVTDVMNRHNQLQKGLRALRYQGAIVSFDWPSAQNALNYLEDRSDARITAEKLVKDGIAVIAFNQLAEARNKCDIDIHILAHSTGAYVIREGFYFASQSRKLSRINWQVSQIVFIAGDIARSSLSRNDLKSHALFSHAARITNYQNPYDAALKLSNVKRMGVAPRIGRVGIPGDAPEMVVNVDVGSYWKDLRNEKKNGKRPSSHSWYFEDKTFAKDLYHTLTGDMDRRVIVTRTFKEGELLLQG